MPEFINENAGLTYGPASLQQVINNSITSPLFNSGFVIRGLYKLGKGINYNGYYYDILKDESQDANLTLVIPAKIRPDLVESQIITGQAILSRRLNVITGRIDLLVTLSQLYSKEQKQVSEEDLARIEILQSKSVVGFKDVDGIIRKKIYRQEIVRVCIITGIGAIIDQDILRQLKDAERKFEITFLRVPLTNPAQIGEALTRAEGADIVVLARGGGEQLNVFDSIELAGAALRINSTFITAIGHAVDEPLIQKIADKHFITPTALGQFLHDIVSTTEYELTQSKVKLMTDLKQQIEINFKSQLIDLEKRLVVAEKREKDEKEVNEKKVTEIRKELEGTKSTNTILKVLIIIFIIVWLYNLIARK